MASQSEPITTTDVTNYTGEVLYVGATFGISPLLSMAGLTRGYRVLTGSQYAMSNAITPNAAAQNTVSEDASITTITATSYTASQETNYAEIHELQYVVSYASRALSKVIGGVANVDDVFAQIAGMPVQRKAHMKQLVGDLEYSALRGTGQAWTNAGTAGQTQGLVTAINAVASTDAGGSDLTAEHINTEIERMAGLGAEFNDMVLACGAHQYQAISDLYGFQPQSRNIGGVNLERVVLPVAGNCGVVYDPVMASDDILFVDLEYFRPGFGIVDGYPPIFTEKLGKDGAGDREMLFCIFGIDYFTYKYHGLIESLATS